MGDGGSRFLVAGMAAGRHVGGQWRGNSPGTRTQRLLDNRATRNYSQGDALGVNWKSLCMIIHRYGKERSLELSNIGSR